MRGTVLFLLLLLPSAVGAQADPPPYRGVLLRGMRVRVSAPRLSPEPFTRTVADTRPDTLLLAPVGDETRFVVVPLSEVGRLEVRRRGMGSRAGGLVGAVLGLAAGYGVLQVIQKETACTEGLDCLDRLEEDIGAGLLLTVLTIPLGGVVGFTLGRGIGGLIAPDRWEPVPTDHLRVGVVPGTRGGMTVALTVAF